MVETINGVGKLRINEKIDKKDGMIVTKDFLEKVVREFIRRAVKTMDVVEYCPFATRERQIHSLLAPAISKIVDVFEMESRVDRAWNKIYSDSENSHGWLDYWCYYRNRSFFVELKHDYISYINQGIRKSLKGRWKLAIEQLQAVAKNAKLSALDCEGTVRIAFCIIPLFFKVSPKRNKQINEEGLYNIQDYVMENLGIESKNPNWSAMWVLPKKYSEKNFQYTDCEERYPAVIFAAYVFDVIR
jgi:hypothetical protein